MKFSELREVMSSDITRSAEAWSYNLTFTSRIKLILMPAMSAVLLYRISHYFYKNNLKAVAWIVWAINLILTGAELMPSSEIGRGFMLGHPMGTIVAAKLGENVLLYGQAIIGGGMGDKEKDVGAGKGLPLLEDNVTVGIRATILGPVVIGEGAAISACAFVHKNVPAGAKALGNPIRIVRGAVSKETKDVSPVDSKKD